jgi:hypothetical protein
MTTITTTAPAPFSPVGPQAFAGDLCAEVAALAVQSGEDSRAVEDQIQQTDEAIASGEAADEVSALRKKADDLMTQGIVDGCATMGEGALQAASAGCSFAASGASATSAARLGAEGAWYKSGATGLDGSIKLVDGAFGQAEANADAAAKQAEQNADRANQSARDAHDAASAQQSTVEKTLDFYEQCAQAQASTAQAILRPA